jgi:hypothetical protein
MPRKNDLDRYCLAWFEEGPRRTGKPRAALWRGAKWPDASVIRVSFLEGHRALRDRVADAAQKWLDRTSLTFEFRDDTTATPVRIGFKKGYGSWSRIGTTCKKVPKGQSTMNFGWIDRWSSKEEVEAVVLHEFGHVLGMVHEHQQPAAGIKWRKEVVYAELKKTHGWSKEQVDLNLLRPEKKKETNFTEFDPKSIMIYPIRAHWTEDGFSAVAPTKLSQTDKKFIRAEYP